MMERSKPKRAYSRLASRSERAALYFGIYLAMGGTRTIHSLWELVRRTGVTEKTLERYSADFSWQRQLLETAGEREKKVQLESADLVAEMNERQATTFKDLFSLVRFGLDHYQSLVAEQNKVGLPKGLKMDVADLARLAESAQRGERLARGVATSKTEVIIEVVAPLVKEIMAVFLAVNVITNDPADVVNKRQAEFIKRGDAILATYYEKPSVKRLTTGRGKVE
jgi:hypothetical protein